MNPKKLWCSALVLLAVLVVVNIGLHYAAHGTQRGKLLARLRQVPLDADCLFVGNSLMEAGCDLDAFAAGLEQKNSARFSNLALGGTSPLEHYLILRKAYERPIHPRLIVYGFMDDQLYSNVSVRWNDLTGNRGFCYYFPSETAALVRPESWFVRAQLQVVAHLPMLAERSALWAKVEKLRRALGGLGMAPARQGRFGRTHDFLALEAKDTASFDARCRSILQRKESFSVPIQKLIDLAHEHGASVVLVEMPMPSHHHQMFYSSPAWRQFEQWIAASANEHQSAYIGAADWVGNDDGFDDPLHLNHTGAKQFSTRLARELSKLTVSSPLPGLDRIRFEAVIRGDSGELVGEQRPIQRAVRDEIVCASTDHKQPRGGVAQAGRRARGQ